MARRATLRADTQHVTLPRRTISTGGAFAMPGSSTGAVGVRVFAAVAAVLTLPDLASAAEWRAFANSRFGFSVEVPATFRAAAPPANGDGLRFTSSDGTVVVRTYGHLLSSPGALGADAQETMTSEAQDGLVVTYRAISRTGYALSGLAGARIVYIRAVSTCGRDAAAMVRVDYPAALKATLDPLIAHMAASLRGSARC